MKNIKIFEEYEPPTNNVDDDEVGKFSTDENELNPRSWKFSEAIEKCINDNCKEIPWEGTEIDKYGIKEDIINWFESNGYKIMRNK